MYLNAATSASSDLIILYQQVYREMVKDWPDKLRRRVEAVTRTPEGRMFLAQEEEEGEADVEMAELVTAEEEELGDDSDIPNRALWMPDLQEEATSRLNLLMKYDSMSEIGPAVVNIVLAAHALDYMLQVSP